MDEELRFVATPEKGEVSALLNRPDGATHQLILGHGASTNMRHATLGANRKRLPPDTGSRASFHVRPLKRGVRQRR